MKKIVTLLFVSVFAFTSCSDDGAVGPQGPPGIPGEDGVNIVGQTYETPAVNFEYFAETNYYSALILIPAEIEILPSDAILVYRLEVLEDEGGQFDAWSLIPQNFFLEQGIIQYVYNHTDGDVELIIDGNFDLSNLDNGFTQNQIFRFVIIPSDQALSADVNISDYNDVMRTLGLDEADVKKLGNNSK